MKIISMSYVDNIANLIYNVAYIIPVKVKRGNHGKQRKRF